MLDKDIHTPPDHSDIPLPPAAVSLLSLNMLSLFPHTNKDHSPLRFPTPSKALRFLSQTAPQKTFPLPLHNRPRLTEP